MLADHGYSEAEVRRHSLAWLRTSIEVLGEMAQTRERGELVARTLSVYQGTVGAHSEEGNQQMREFIDALLHPEDDDYFVNPEAKPDLTAVRQFNATSVGFERVKA